ncbi:MAG: transcription antitermination factor NusB [Treponema sp.]|nr:transcription antitermination factor NusB [Treponema sp.]
MSRRKGRILAFQGVYSWDVSKSSVEDILKFSWLQKDSESEDKEQEQSPAPEVLEERTFASLIITGTIEHIQEIDELIKNHLSENWTLERINKVSLAILRTSIFEMKFQNGSQPKIVIDEAVNIAREYGLEDSYKFINAVLDKIGKEV